MKTKKILTANLTPGMVTAESAYTYTNHLVIQSNTVLTDEIIDKLKYYAVKSVKILVEEDSDEASNNTTDNSDHCLLLLQKQLHSHRSRPRPGRADG